MQIRQAMKTAAIVWFKTDLRVHDHEPLTNAIKATNGRIIPVYCFDPRQFQKTHFFGLPRASPHKTRFLLESVKDLRESFKKLGSDLTVRIGHPEDIIDNIVNDLAQENITVEGVYSHQEVCDEEMRVEKRLIKRLKTKNVQLKTVWGGQTMHHISELPFIPTGKGSEALNVFTQFRKRIEGSDYDVREPFLAPKKSDISPVETKLDKGDMPSVLELIKLGGDDNVTHWLYHAKKFNYDVETGKELPVQPSEDSQNNAVTKPNNDNKTIKPITFSGGETVALEHSNYYIWKSKLIQTYKDTRNGLLGMDYSSKYSPWLALGCISARHLYYEIRKFEREVTQNESTGHLIFELLWRDYFKFLMVKYGTEIFHLEGLTKYHGQYKERKWLVDKNNFQKWCDGVTGLSFVDANMREMNRTGFMSNRGRQNVASFLTKDLFVDWRMGAEFFESMLLDYDTCSNYGNWLYVAGVGTDPREDRYFNVIKQATMYDPKQEYVKHWLPELGTASYPKPIANVTYHVTPKQQQQGGPKPRPITVRQYNRKKPNLFN
jgi:deoxyribodipyrimidine photo-lyase